MSFFGSIGTIMNGSGISAMFQTIYDENATKHILSGKTTSRAARAHILAESALLIKLQEMVLNDSDNAIDIDAIKTYMKVLFQLNKSMQLVVPQHLNHYSMPLKRRSLF